METCDVSTVNLRIEGWNEHKFLSFPLPNNMSFTFKQIRNRFLQNLLHADVVLSTDSWILGSRAQGGKDWAGGRWLGGWGGFGAWRSGNSTCRTGFLPGFREAGGRHLTCTNLSFLSLSVRRRPTTYLHSMHAVASRRRKPRHPFAPSFVSHRSGDIWSPVAAKVSAARKAGVSRRGGERPTSC